MPGAPTAPAAPAAPAAPEAPAAATTTSSSKGGKSEGPIQRSSVLRNAFFLSWMHKRWAELRFWAAAEKCFQQRVIGSRQQIGNLDRVCLSLWKNLRIKFIRGEVTLLMADELICPPPSR